jgi:hypothetical protein
MKEQFFSSWKSGPGFECINERNHYEMNGNWIGIAAEFIPRVITMVSSHERWVERRAWRKRQTAKWLTGQKIMFSFKMHLNLLEFVCQNCCLKGQIDWPGRYNFNSAAMRQMLCLYLGTLLLYKTVINDLSIPRSTHCPIMRSNAVRPNRPTIILERAFVCCELWWCVCVCGEKAALIKYSNTEPQTLQMLI